MKSANYPRSSTIVMAFFTTDNRGLFQGSQRPDGAGGACGCGVLRWPREHATMSQKADDGIDRGIRLSRRWLVALLATLALSLVALAFALGRLTASSHTGTVAPPAALASTDDAPVGDTSPAPEGTASAPTLRLDTPALPAQELASEASPTSQVTLGTSAPPEHAAVRSYFEQVDQLEDVGIGSDAQGFAMSILQSMASGDSSGFDTLVGHARTQQAKLRAVTPPAACADYHRQAVSLAAESVSMLERLRASLAAGDSSALATMATAGRDLGSRANALKLLGDSIKKQSGL